MSGILGVLSAAAMAFGGLVARRRRAWCPDFNRRSRGHVVGAIPGACPFPLRCGHPLRSPVNGRIA
jgi:hypothetical protein